MYLPSMVVAPILCAMHLVSGTNAESLGEPDDALLLQTRAVAKTGPTCDEELRGPKDADYRGCQTSTLSGRKCQKWTAQSPHAHSRTPDSQRFSGKGLGDHNYCRNPDEENTIWCYTMTATRRWEFCDPLPCITGAIPDERAMPHNPIGSCTQPARTAIGSCGYYKDKCDSLADTLYDCFEDWLQCESVVDICSNQSATMHECTLAVAAAGVHHHPAWDPAANPCAHALHMKQVLVHQGCQNYADAIQGPVSAALQQCQMWCGAEQRYCLKGPVSIVRALCYEHMACYLGNYVDERLTHAVNECQSEEKTPEETLFCGMCGFGECPTGWDITKWDGSSDPKESDSHPGWDTNSGGQNEIRRSFSGPGAEPGPGLLQSRSDAGELNADEEVSVTGGFFARRSERRVFEEEHFARFEEVLSEKACDRKCKKKSVKSAR